MASLQPQFGWTNPDADYHTGKLIKIHYQFVVMDISHY